MSGLNESRAVPVYLLRSRSFTASPTMNSHLLITAVFVSALLTLRAQELSGQSDAPNVRKPLEWNDPKWWEAMEPKPSGIKLGKSDLVIEGLAVDAFRAAPRSFEKRNLARRFLSLPWVNPFASRPTPLAARRENYFAWGDRDAPWSLLADKPIPGPQSVLVSVSR